MSLIEVIGSAINRVMAELDYWIAITLGTLSIIETEELAPMPNPTILEDMVAEAAYYRADHRGFADRDDISDWLEAEKEILERFSSK